MATVSKGRNLDLWPVTCGRDEGRVWTAILVYLVLRLVGLPGQAQRCLPRVKDHLIDGPLATSLDILLE